MRKIALLRLPGFLILLSALIITVPHAVRNANAMQPAAVPPHPRPDGTPWTIAYIEGGEYSEYRDSLTALFKSLMQQGWLPQMPVPDFSNATSRDIWRWAGGLESPFLRFGQDAYFTSDWKNENRARTRAALYAAIPEKKIDLVFALGTWAGLDLSREDPGAPVIVMAASDAVSGGLFRNDTPGDPPWLHARIDPHRFERQLRIFHDIIGFKTLGVAYKDTTAGRSYAALDTVRKIARERQFSIVSCTIADGHTQKEEEALLSACFDTLLKEADALYITAQKALNPATLPGLVEKALLANTPTFSQSGSNEVRSGFLMSISQAGFRYVGDFYAETMIQILGGTAPGALPMLFADPPKIAINLMTAKQIGYDPPVDVLGAADEIFLKIYSP